MTVRDANFADIPQIADLLVEAHGRSRYAGTDVQVEIRDRKLTATVVKLPFVRNGKALVS